MEAPLARRGGEDAPPLSGLLILIGGPIASGKSTLSRAVAQRLRQAGTSAACVDVDLVYELLEERGHSPGEARIWRRAHRLAGRIAAALFAEGIEIVLVESDFLAEDRRRELRETAGASDIRAITLRASLETALARVRLDDDRSISRDPEFLARHYEEVGPALAQRPEGELVLDTDALSLEEAVTATVAACGSSLRRGSR